MTDQTSTLYAKLLGETAIIEWKALERFWAKGDLIWVDPALDLITVAAAIAENQGEMFAKWRAEGNDVPASAEEEPDQQAQVPQKLEVGVLAIGVIPTKPATKQRGFFVGRSEERR